MKISKEQFEELISLYLDGEASKEELSLLEDCLHHNEINKKIFYDACKVHIAYCGMFGKKVELHPLKGIKLNFGRPKRQNLQRLIMEWFVLCCLIMTCGLMCYLAFRERGNIAPLSELDEINNEMSGDFDVEIREYPEYAPDNSYYGIIKITKKSTSESRNLRENEKKDK